jgi:serine/threonine-protein kinase
MIGTRIGSWLITEEIGDGGHAFVFKGIQGDASVAIKMLKPSVAHEDNLEKRFQIEAETLKTLNHPGIVGFNEYLHLNTYHYMILELMDAGSVEHIVRTTGPIEPRYALPIIYQVVRGLECAHSFGYIHRDIKPNNILLNKAGQAKITDFGIAKVIGGETFTQKGFVLGTALYMAPEYLSQGIVTPQTDIYALGVTLFEMVTNRKPFEFERDDEPLVSFAKRVCAGEPAAPSSFRPIPPALERIIMRALARDTKRRYRSMDRLAADLCKAFPDLVERAIEIPEGRPRTALHPLTPSAASAAASESQTPVRPVRSGLQPAAILGAAAAAGAVAGILATLFEQTPATAATAALITVALVLAAGFGIRSARGGSRQRRGRAPASRPATTALGDGAPIDSAEAVEDRVPFHAGAPPEVAAQSQISELSAFLEVTEGDSRGKRFGLRPISRVGRDLRFDIRPRDPEISRQHSVIHFDGTGFKIKDLGSRNGTFVNEERVEGEMDLVHGAIVRVGRTSMRFEYQPGS